MQKFFNDLAVQQFNQQLQPANNLSSFVYTNALLQLADKMTTPIMHFWTLEDTVILGLKDQRLPHLPAALKLLTTRGYHYFMRNSGGLAVVSDSGILNLSLFFPWHVLGHELTIDEAYQEMVNLIQAAFPTLQIETGEITHSYCPGTFDISVNGQKIGGISQRRNARGVVVMLYISVCGDQLHRGEVIRDFYDAGLQDEENKWHFPDVWPTAMTTLEQLLGTPLTIADTVNKIKQVCSLTETTSLDNLMWSSDFITALNRELTSMDRLQERLQKED